ncbi:PEP-CTERM protein-sorting domain-containing protein [Singulisphaera sp. GP187]|uniref:PEP-CTERM sorting domain-containing protein n=1 Tax=Singulisphaera sp. GP187 TaxID=1882752 RepID=UPI00092AB272|nr:PEP-CTERM sorting domain-containing protein [Singulisphaera sp. GP187]SIO29530.1 PEP-CTERM protein-sorting domain-containing protein [Singulisphaera sp. GP187]
MERSILTRFSLHFCFTVALVGATLSTARAANIPAYTVTDLGTGTAQVSTDAGGNGIVIAPDGQTTYTFPNTSSSNYPSEAEWLSIRSKLPPLTNAPVHNSWTYGNPNNAYSYYEGGLLNQNGFFVGTNTFGVTGHISGAGSLVFATQRQADGSFSTPITLWDSPNNHSTGEQMATAMFINNQNQVLGMGGVPYSATSYYTKNFYLYDMQTQIRTDLKDLLPGWHLETELGLDDQGRMLLSAWKWDDKLGIQYHSLLLTPPGLVIGDPVTVPEPTSLATLMLGLGGYLAFRHSRRGEPRESR